MSEARNAPAAVRMGTGPAREETGTQARKKPDQAKLGSGTRRGFSPAPSHCHRAIACSCLAGEKCEYWGAEHQRNPTPSFPKQPACNAHAPNYPPAPESTDRRGSSFEQLLAGETSSNPFEGACRIRKDGQMAQPHAGKGISRRSESHSVMVACGWGLSG